MPSGARSARRQPEAERLSLCVRLAGNFAIEACGGRTIDLCAGIGTLAFHVFWRGYYARANGEPQKSSASSAILPMSRSVARCCRKPNGSAQTCSILTLRALDASVLRLQIRRSEPLPGAAADCATPGGPCGIHSDHFPAAWLRRLMRLCASCLARRRDEGRAPSLWSMTIGPS